jgi:hypothetical protein
MKFIAASDRLRLIKIAEKAHMCPQAEKGLSPVG